MALLWQPNLSKKNNQNWNKLSHNFGAMRTTLQNLCSDDMSEVTEFTYPEYSRPRPVCASNQQQHCRRRSQSRPS